MNIQIEFEKVFGASPTHLTRAPGRVNLIGEHTDYNDGFVLPMAIDRAVWIAARKRDDRIVRMVALDFGGEQSQFSLDDTLAPQPLGGAGVRPDPIRPWSNYVRGVARLLGSNLVGADMLIRGNVPIGSGLSSSAALEVCAAVTFKRLGDSQIVISREQSDREIFSFKLENEISRSARNDKTTLHIAVRLELARVCQRAENEFVGVQSGIMDQFVSLLAREGHALWIDCRDLSYEHVPLPRGAAIVVCDTKKRRELVDSKYNARRAECAEAARLLGVRSLRDASWDDLKKLSGVVERRVRHVISENDRVKRAVKACRQNDLATLGRLMNESHASLRDDYQVSCAELDAIVEIAQKQMGCFGARLTGAGFGGCTVNLVDERAVPGFVENVGREYTARVGIAPEIFVCRASEGATYQE